MHDNSSIGTKPVNTALAIGVKILANAQKSSKSELLLLFYQKFSPIINFMT